GPPARVAAVSPADKGPGEGVHARAGAAVLGRVGPVCPALTRPLCHRLLHGAAPRGTDWPPARRRPDEPRRWASAPTAQDRAIPGPAVLDAAPDPGAYKERQDSVGGRGCGPGCALRSHRGRATEACAPARMAAGAALDVRDLGWLPVRPVAHREELPPHAAPCGARGHWSLTTLHAAQLRLLAHRPGTQREVATAAARPRVHHDHLRCLWRLVPASRCRGGRRPCRRAAWQQSWQHGGPMIPKPRAARVIHTRSVLSGQDGRLRKVVEVPS